MDSVICLWQYDPSANIRDVWKLVESYRLDDTGHATTPTKYGNDSRYPYLEFIDPKRTRAWPEGRAVTVWNLRSGVSLMAFNQPSRCEWIDAGDIKELPNWFKFIRGGWGMVEGTVAEVQKLFGLEAKQ